MLLAFKRKGTDMQHRTPRVGVFLVGVAALMALVVAGSATGRDQTKPSNQQEPFVAATVEVPGKANAPAEVSPPTVSGNAAVGQQLAASTGTWSGTQPISYTFAWQTCNAGITSCSGTGKKGSTYVVAASDAGKRLRVK